MQDKIRYETSVGDLDPSALTGFFEGWPNPPSPATHVAILRGSAHVVLAWEGDHVVGFINAVSDGFFAAFITLLEVRPTHRGKGIGTELARRMLDELKDYYSVDLVCDAAVRPFYERLGLQAMTAMSVRHLDRQATGALP